MTRSLVLLSGGLDSTVCARLVASQGHEVHAISFRYGQKHQDVEIRAAIDVAHNLQVASHQVIDIPPSIFEGAGSALVPDDGTPMPHESYQQLSEAEGPSPTYVPYRNGTLLSIAVARALALGAYEVVAGAHAEDAHNFAYPDCTPEFNGAMAAAVYIGTYHKVRLRFPFQEATKTDIVRIGVLTRAPLFLTWSCYEGGDKPCGECPTCVGRAHAFAEAGIEDPALT